MSKFYTTLLAISLSWLATTFVSCTDEINDFTLEEEEIGVYGIEPAQREINNLGGEVSISFLSLGDWSVESDVEWCEVLTPSGVSGDSKIKLRIAPNADDNNDRTATIFITIDGFKDMDLCTVLQSSRIKVNIVGTAANCWISDVLSTQYLWNEEFNNIRESLNHKVSDPQKFLTTALSSMDSNNEDGGNYPNNGGRYYYSQLDVYQQSPYSAATRGMSIAGDYGINMVYPVGIGDGTYYIWVVSVTEESPADKAGIKRGMYITSYNHAKIIESNLATVYTTLMGQNEAQGTLELGLSQQVIDGEVIKLEELDNVWVTPTSYTDNPIIYADVLTTEESAHKAAYLVYDKFDQFADEQLIKQFESFKASGATDLILDLRYNLGGDVYSSAVMASAIVGTEHKGDVYCHMEFNEYRRSRGEVDYFYIGENPTVNDYPLIEKAAQTTLGLKRVYVITTNFTASASELVINGLRGLGIEVIVIGQTTEGKNVGMEGILSLNSTEGYNFGDYQYVFMPITFYNRNAQGFKDFSDGFKPDFEYVETLNVIADWDQGRDVCLNAALQHISEGTWPKITTPAAAPATRGAQFEVINRADLQPQQRGAVVIR